MMNIDSKHFLLLLSLVIILQSCRSGSGKNNKEAVSPELSKAAMPDSSVNTFLELRNALKTPDSLRHVTNDSITVLVLTTSDEMEYLVAHPYPGDADGSFIGFEISHLSSDLIDYPNIKIPANRFTTQNGIYLGMPMNDLLKVKGEPGNRHDVEGLTTLTYLGAPKDFLDRHKSEEYIFECQVANGTVARIRFGFVPLQEESQLKSLDSVSQF